MFPVWTTGVRRESDGRREDVWDVWNREITHEAGVDVEVG